MSRLAVLLLVLMVLIPAPLAAQTGPEPIEPPIFPPDPCFDCWWSDEPVSTLEQLSADPDMRNGLVVGQYELLLANCGGADAGSGPAGGEPPSVSVTTSPVDSGERAMWWIGAGVVAATVLLFSVALLGPGRLRGLPRRS